MNKLIPKTAIFILSWAAVTAAGPLDPPSGPVEPTGPTGIFSVPFTIDESGSYRLREDVALTNGATAITITVDNVTLDLGDHIVENSTGPGAVAIALSSSRSGITIRGGLLHGWTYLLDERATGEEDSRVLIEDLRFEGANGIQAPDSRACTVRRCQIKTLGPGIVLGDLARVEHCDVLAVNDVRTGKGIEAGRAAIVEACRVEFGEYGILAGEDSSIRDSVVLNSSQAGIVGGNIQGCSAIDCVKTGIEAGGGIVTSSKGVAGDLSGIFALGGVVTDSIGISTNGNGIIASLATLSSGWNTGGTSEVGIESTIAVGCKSDGGTDVTYKYDMP